MLKLATPEQKTLFYIIYATRILKNFNADPKNFDADPEFILYKSPDPKCRFGTKHEAVPEKFAGMVITSWYGTVPH